MKQTQFLLLLIICIMMGCSEKKPVSEKERRQMFQIDTTEIVKGVQRMQVIHIQQDIKSNNKVYKLAIDRKPCDSLPPVKSDMGTFADNSISVKILHDNGKQMFSKVFTKHTFAPYLNDKFLSHSVLEGVVFDDIKTAATREITLAASVSYPMTDLYVPFTIVISPVGKMSILKDEDLGELPLDDEP